MRLLVNGNILSFCLSSVIVVIPMMINGGCNDNYEFWVKISEKTQALVYQVDGDHVIGHDLQQMGV